MRRRLLSGIIFFVVCISNAQALLGDSESTSAIPGEGLQAEGVKQWQKAISIYLDTLFKEPKRVDLWLRIASIEHQLKNYPLTIDAYQHAILLTPYDPTLHSNLSAIYAESNHPKEALLAINEAVTLQPQRADYLVARAKIANWNQAYATALDSYQRLLVLSKTTTIPMSLFEIYMQMGSVNNQLHQYPEAIQAYQQALLQNPTNATVYQSISQIYAVNKQPDKALEAINQALLLDPNNREYLNAKAILATWSKQYKIAAETYQQMLQLAPNDKGASKGLALVQHLMTLPQSFGELKPLSPFEQLINEANNRATSHQYESAVKAMKMAIALKPNAPSLYKTLSEMYASAKKPAQALAAINKALSLTPTNIDYLRARAKLASWVKDKPQTEDSYARILQLRPHDEDALLNYAHTLAWRGETDAATNAYQHLLHEYPKNAEGWVQYAEVLSWPGNYLGALNALKRYKELKGETREYLKTRAKVLVLIGRFKSARAINEPLLRATPNDSYLLATEVTALVKAIQLKQALPYLGKALQISPDDPQLKGLHDVILTPLRSNVNLETDYTAANDTTRILDVPVSGQYFLTPTTSLLLQGLYERATAAPGSFLEPFDGDYPISDKSAKVGFATQIDSLNLKGLVGGLTIQGKNSHFIYDALANTNLGEKAQITVETFQDLYRAYLVPQTPRSISLQIMETRYSALLRWQPLPQQYLNAFISYSDLTYNNYWHLNVWPKSRVFASEHWQVTVGVDSDIWSYKNRAMDGYYSPLLFQGYEGTVELYFAQSENIGYGASAGFGMQKDEQFPRFFYEEDLAAQMFMGIFTDWELQAKAGYTLRANPSGYYDCWTLGLVLTRRF